MTQVGSSAVCVYYGQHVVRTVWVTVTGHSKWTLTELCALRFVLPVILHNYAACLCFFILPLSPSCSLYLIISIRSVAAWVLWVLLCTLRMRNACVCISNWKNIKHSSSAALTDSFLQQLLPKSLGQMQLASLQINVNKWQPQVQEALEIRLINHLTTLYTYATIRWTQRGPRQSAC